MVRCKCLPAAALGAALFAAPSVPAWSQEVTATGPAVSTQVAAVQKFADRDLLADTMKSLDGDADSVSLGNSVNALSDDQVVELNRSLNNLNRNVFTAPAGFQFDGAEFDAVQFLGRITEDFNKHQIRALTKALEEKIKFLYLAEKTGNDRFRELADRQEQKFLAKIDRFAKETDATGGSETASGDASGETLKSVSKTAKGRAIKETKLNGKAAATRAAKDEAKEAIKRDIKNHAKKAAKGGKKS